MITFMDKLEIIRMHLSGKSNREIARQLQLNRKTVDKYVLDYKQAHDDLLYADDADKEKLREITERLTAAPEYRKRKSPPRKWNKQMDDFLNEILASEAKKYTQLCTSKQQLTTRQIHQLMVEEGFDIGLTTVSNKIREKKDKPKEAFIAQTYRFGQRFEFDFGEVNVCLGGKLTKLYLAVMTAPASGYRYARLYRNQKYDVFIDAQVRFFEHMGGCFEEGVYDNMRNVVSKFIGRNEKEINPKLIKFSLYYGFRVNVTNCFSGNEKGSVESSVKVIRNAAFARQWEFSDISSAQAYLDEVLATLNKGKDAESERQALTPYRIPYESADIRTDAHVDKYSCVRVDKVSYSVPDAYVGKQMIVKAYPNEIVIMHHKQVVARHMRSFVAGDMVLDINHYLHTFLKKPGAIANSKALSANTKLKEIFESDYKQNPKEFARILLACKNGTFENALNALRNHCTTNTSIDTDVAHSAIAAQTLSQIAQISVIGKEVA